MLLSVLQAVESYSRETPRVGGKEKLKKNHKQSKVECKMQTDRSGEAELLAGRRRDPS